MNVTVYLGANEGNDPELARAVESFGAWIGTSGNSLVYGGSKSGLMGRIAMAALAAGAQVTGVEPQFFIDAEKQLDGLTELIVTPDIATRRAKMIELGDAFVAFPGGTGTLEEVSEVMSMSCLGRLEAPVVLFNLNGFYDGLKMQLARMVQTGLTTPERLMDVRIVDTLADIERVIEAVR